MNLDNIKGPSIEWFEVRWKIHTSQDDDGQVLCVCMIKSINRLGFDTFCNELECLRLCYN